MEGAINTRTGLRALDSEQRRSDLPSPVDPKSEVASFELMLPEPLETGTTALPAPFPTQAARILSAAIDLSQLVAADQTVSDLHGEASNGDHHAELDSTSVPDSQETGVLDPFAEKLDLFSVGKLPAITLENSASASNLIPHSVPQGNNSWAEAGKDPLEPSLSNEGRPIRVPRKAPTVLVHSELYNLELAPKRAAAVPFEMVPAAVSDDGIVSGSPARLNAPSSNQIDTEAPIRQNPGLSGSQNIPVPLETTVGKEDGLQISAGSDAPLEVGEGSEASIASHTKITVVRTETHFPPAVPGPIVQQIGRAIVAEIGHRAVKVPGTPTAPVLQLVRSLELQLEPRELGPVTVRMSILNTSLRISLKVKDDKIAAQIEGSQSELAQSLKDTGISLDDFVVQAVYTRQDVQGGAASHSPSTAISSNNGTQFGAMEGGGGSQDGDGQRGQGGKTGDKSQESQSLQTEPNQGVNRSGVYL